MVKITKGAKKKIIFHVKGIIKNKKIKNTYFSDLVIKRIKFINITFENVTFTKNYITNTIFCDCIFINCKFRYNSMTATNISNCIFKKCNSANEWNVYTNITNCAFKECTIFGAANHISLKIKDCKVKNSIIKECNFNIENFKNGNKITNTCIKKNYVYTIRKTRKLLATTGMMPLEPITIIIRNCNIDKCATVKEFIKLLKIDKSNTKITNCKII